MSWMSRLLICLFAFVLAIGDGFAGGFNEVAPSDLGHLKKVELWATQYYGRHHVRDDATFGVGAFGYRLVPFRTIAADRRVFKPGTVFFVPGLAGVRFEHEGVSEVHDGYVFFGDVGGAVRGHHIDIYTGAMRKNPAPDIITSTRHKPFAAYIVADEAVIERLRQQHTRSH